MKCIRLTDELLDELGESYQKFKELTPGVTFIQYVESCVRGMEYELNYCAPNAGIS